MDGGRYGVIEVEQSACSLERDRVEQSRVVLELDPGLRPERAKKMLRVYAREPTFDEACAAFEVERHGHHRRRADLLRQVHPVLAKPLQEHVASQRESRQRKGLVRVLADQSSHHTVEIRRLARVIQPTRARHRPIASPEDQSICCPAALVREREKPAQVVRPDGAFQSVENQQTATMRRAGATRLEAMQIDRIAIIHHPAFDSSLQRWRATHELSPEGTQMCARYPPCGGVGILAGTAHVTGTGVEARNRRPFYNIEPARMDVQIFGVKKNADTRKALRFFAERRVKTHFVDLMERAASRGELARFAQKFGATALIDETARRYSELGLRTARYGDERWLEVLVDEPLILKMPLVRYGNALSIGAADATWKGWLTA